MAGQVLVAGWSGRAYAITTWPAQGTLSGAADPGLYPVVIRPESRLPSIGAGTNTHSIKYTHNDISRMDYINGSGSRVCGMGVHTR